ncbi:Zinc-type alcohol dehydrogenase-like protein [Nymphon striatum]|nr:Zinc-type alcohol dehydrogenase-like protein [Nymphon striatum]
MKVVGYYKSLPINDEKSLIDLELDKPTATGSDLLIKVGAISVNPVDTKIRMRRASDGQSPIVLGWDAVGEVVAIGSDVSHYKVGDRVWYAGAIDRQGTNAEYHLVDERIVGKKPENISDIPSSGLLLAILIIGGAGGVGSIAIQLLRALTDLTVIATASRAETKDWVKELGAHHVIDHSKPLAAQIKSLNIGQPGFVFSTTHSHLYVEQIAELILTPRQVRANR